MTYTVRRVRVKSAAKVAFVCLLIATLPMIPVMLQTSTITGYGFGELTVTAGDRVVSLLRALAVPLMYGAFAALGAALVALIYNISVRFHGGIKLDIEWEDAAGEAKKKN